VRRDAVYHRLSVKAENGLGDDASHRIECIAHAVERTVLALWIAARVLFFAMRDNELRLQRDR
jgi:hypothetical protein